MASAPAGYIGVPTQVPIIEQTEQLVYISSKFLEKYFTVETPEKSNELPWSISDREDGKVKFIPGNIGINSKSASIILTAKTALSSFELRGEYHTEYNADRINCILNERYLIENGSGEKPDFSVWKGNLAEGERFEIRYTTDSGTHAADEANTNFYLVAQIKEMVDTVVGYETKNVARKIKKAYIGVNGVARKVKRAYVGVKPITIPPDYTQVEYIQSSGTQYIDTGFKPNDNTRVVLDGQFTSSAVSQFLFGCRTGTNTVNYCILTRTAGFRSDYGESKVENTSVANTERFIFDKNKNICTIGSAEITNAVSTFQSAYSLALFASNDGGSAKYYGSMKLYSCKIYDNGTIVRDYVPCKNAVGTVGLYDLVQSQFYENAGTDVFAAGPDVETKELPSAARLCFNGSGKLKYHSTLTMDKSWYGMAAASAGDHALFAGGINGGWGGGVLNNVKAFDRALAQQYITGLSDARELLAATTVGDYAIFGGGRNSNGSVSNVDAYDASLTRTNPSSLSDRRNQLAATTVGGYALFGGGMNAYANPTSVVDAYSTSLSRSTRTALKYPRICLAAATVGGYALFAGGHDNNTTTYYSAVEAYDESLTKIANPTDLSVARSYLSATAVGDYAIFAGGMSTGSARSDVVDAYNISLTRSNPTMLRDKRAQIAATTVGGYALFAGGIKSEIRFSAIVEAYDESLTRTLPTELPSPTYNFAATTVGDYALFAGGHRNHGPNNESNEFSDKVYVYAAE